ncbi:MAG TPA: Na/Pi symporter [Vicinamibacterales bacterium]|nr:Na/Pi symporter [Vicinamibacterales bacterium]
MHWPTIILEVVGGLVLFLFGVLQLARAIEPLASDRARELLDRFTTNRFAGVLTGAIATTVLDSSSVTIILVIALVNGGLLTFTQSLGVIMGSNIGTTVSSQIFALDVEAYSPVILFVGFLLFVTAGRSETRRHVGLAVLGLGLVFFGLNYIGEAVGPLRDDPQFMRRMAGLERPLVGLAVGAIATVIIQSSSAMLGIVITLASQDLLTLPAGLALMLGAEIGTCADTLVAAIGRTRAALRAGVFHLTFNIVSAVIGVLLIDHLAAVATALPGGDSLPRQIANAHMTFNVLGVAAFIGFTPLIARLLNYVVPDARGDGPASHEGTEKIHQPE